MADLDKEINMNETFANQFKAVEAPAQRGMRSVRDRNFIVVSMHEDGTFSMSKNPVVHTNSTSANDARVSLAKLNPGTAYITMQFCGGSLVPRVVGVAEF